MRWICAAVIVATLAASGCSDSDQYVTYNQDIGNHSADAANAARVAAENRRAREIDAQNARVSEAARPAEIKRIADQQAKHAAWLAAMTQEQRNRYYQAVAQANWNAAVALQRQHDYIDRYNEATGTPHQCNAYGCW
jgi:hypothetical protein